MNMQVRSAWLTVNSSCNNRCAWCYAKGTEFKNKNMPIGLGKKLLNFLAEIGVKGVVFIGGEPTLYPRLVDMIIEARVLGISPTLLTNGRKFADQKFVDDILRTGLDSIVISAKAADSVQYLELTGVDGYSEMIQGIRNLRLRGIKPTVAITIVKEVIPSIEKLLDNVIAEDVESIAITMGNPIIIGDSTSDESIPTPLELAEVSIAIHRYFKRRNYGKYSIAFDIPLCLLSQADITELKDSGKIKTCCEIQTGGGMVFDQQGQVMPCNFFSNYPVGRFGYDFHDAETFQKFWHGADLHSFRLITRRYPSVKCEKCQHWDSCGGGCFIRWLHYDPNEYIR